MTIPSGTADFIALKRFKVRAGSNASMEWVITVENGSGQVLDKFTAPTMKEAQRDFEQAGYENAFSFGKHLIVTLPRGGVL